MGQSGSWTKKSFREEGFSQKLTKGKLQNTALELLLLVLQDPAALTGNKDYTLGTNSYFNHVFFTLLFIFTRSPPMNEKTFPMIKNSPEDMVPQDLSVKRYM